nr:hypothetical protein [Kiritimatiellia bacterium]
MEIKFKIKNFSGEEKWWRPLEKIDYYKWILGGGDFFSHPDKILLCDVVDDYRSLCYNEPLLAKLVEVPSRPVYIKALFLSWVERGDDWLKAFIYAYQENGEEFYNAVDLANATVWTGVKFDAEHQDKSYEDIGEYFARASGFVDCLIEPEKLRETLRLADFARVQEKYLGERLRASVTFGEWLLIDSEM